MYTLAVAALYRDLSSYLPLRQDIIPTQDYFAFEVVAQIRASPIVVHLCHFLHCQVLLEDINLVYVS